MRPFVVNGDVWRVVQVNGDDPSLIDRTGHFRLATTDPKTKTVSVSKAVEPPLLDRVMLHEVSHAITVSYGLLPFIRLTVPEAFWVPVEEWAAQLVENYGIEAAQTTSEALGRPVCVRGYCHGQS